MNHRLEFLARPTGQAFLPTGAGDGLSRVRAVRCASVGRRAGKWGPPWPRRASQRNERLAGAMNVLMLYPRFVEATFWNPHCSGQLVHRRSITMAPLGLLTIASYLPDDFHVRLVDRNVAPETADDWVWADVVFLSAMAAQEADYTV